LIYKQIPWVKAFSFICLAKRLAEKRL